MRRWDMGNCKYCGEPAGLLRRQHAECAELIEKGRREILAAVSDAASGSAEMNGLPTRVSDISARSYIDDGERRRLLVLGWTNRVNACLEDGVLDEGEEKRLADLKDIFALSSA